jgi:hypothetical protein
MLDGFRRRLAKATEPTGRWWTDLAIAEFGWLRELGVTLDDVELAAGGSVVTLAGRGTGVVLWWEHESSGALGGMVWRNDDRRDALNLVPLLWQYRPDLPAPVGEAREREVAAAATRAWSGALQTIVPIVLDEEAAGGADWEPIRSRWRDHLRARRAVAGS